MEFQRGKEYLRPPDADLSWPAELIAQAATFVGRLPLVIETLDGRKLAGVLDKPTDDAVQLASFYDDDQVIDVRYNKIARFIMPHEPPPDTSGETRGT